MCEVMDLDWGKPNLIWRTVSLLCNKKLASRVAIYEKKIGIWVSRKWPIFPIRDLGW